MRRGLRDVFESGRFDEYQFAKYSGGDAKKDFRLKDILFLARPRARSEEQKELFRKIANSQLRAAETWNKTQMDVARKAKEEGATAERKEEMKLEGWLGQIENRTIGHMALLRNLVNILKLKPTEEQVERVVAELTRVADRGKQFPFRYWSAYKALRGIQKDYNYLRMKPPVQLDRFIENKVISGLNFALKKSVQSLPRFEGRTLVACDVSGSMIEPISEKSDVWNFDVGLVLGVVLKKALKDNAIFGIFGTSFEVIGDVGSPLGTIEGMYRDMNKRVGTGTEGWKVIDWLLTTGTRVDNVMVFTDCQVYGSKAGYSRGRLMEEKWKEYRKAHPSAKMYLFDLSGYGNVPIEIDRNNVVYVAGFSDKVFDAVRHMQEGGTAVDMIRGYTK